MDQSFTEYLARARAVSCSEQASVAMVARIAVGLGIVFYLSRPFSLWKLGAWYALFCMISVATYFLHHYLGPREEPFKPKLWLYSYNALNFIMGCTLSLIPWLFFIENNITYLGFVMAVHVGYLAGAMTINSSSYLSFMFSGIGATLPICIKFLSLGGQPYTSIMFLAIFYLVMLSYISRNINSLFIRSTKNQFENAQLIDELRREKSAVEKLSREKNQFLAAASHDLRQPLHSATLLLSTLKEEVTTPKQMTLLGSVTKSFDALRISFNSLLDMSKLEAGVVDFNPEVVSVDSLIKQLASEFDQEIKENGLELSCNLNEVLVNTDPDLLSRVLRNLLSNAIHFTENGGIVINAQQTSENRLRISVIDSGKGIPKDKLEIVFSEYYQLDNPERDRNKGFGLGLSIVKRLCKLLDVDIYVESEVGVGTTFHLDMAMLTELDDQTIIHQKSEQANDFSEELFNDKLILAIDDDQVVLESMQSLLGSWNCVCLFAESPESAIEQLSRSDKLPDLIVTDYRLRDNITGTESAKKICLEFNLDIPIIIVTGDTSPKRLRELNSSGYTVLNKPVSEEELKTTILSTIKKTDS